MNLKTPKHSVDSATLKVVLGIYYQINDWLENSAYIEQAREELQRAGLDTGDKEPQSYTKKMQILTYYGFICWEDDSSMSRRRITDIGKCFYQAWVNDDTDDMIQIVLSSLRQTVFGRSNNGIPDSDSDVEVPCLALRACIDLGKLTSLIYVYLIQMIQNHGYSYTQVIQDIKDKNYLIDSNIIEQSCNKYKDWKPISFLKEVGLFEELSHEYIIPAVVLDKYGKIIKSLPIFNVDKFIFEDSLQKLRHSKVVVPFSYNSSQFYPFLTALRTKPFLLLAGISGTGKSRIVRKLAQASVTEKLQKKYDKEYKGTDFKEDRWSLHSPANFHLIQVKPNWHNSMDVVGYFSNIPTPHYVFTPFVEFIVRAWQNPDVPFFLCLDEMNLAPVEEYFAEFLSAIESRGLEKDKDGKNVYVTDPIIKPFDEFGTYDVANNQGKNNDSWPISVQMIQELNASLSEDMNNKIEKHFRFKGLTLPANLMVIGTVNMDETTFSFSRKVLDRAMSIEMNEVDYDSFLQDTTDDGLKEIVADFDAGKYGDGVTLNDLLVNRPVEAKDIIGKLGEDAQTVIDYLKKVNSLLEGTPFKLGYRAANEALIYLLASYDFGQANRMAALDRFTMMKILSRVEGDEAKLKLSLDSKTDKERLDEAGIDVDEAIKYGELNLLTALRYLFASTFGEKEGEEWLSVKKTDTMIGQLGRDHFVSYWN